MATTTIDVIPEGRYGCMECQGPFVYVLVEQDEDTCQLYCTRHLPDGAFPVSLGRTLQPVDGVRLAELAREIREMRAAPDEPVAPGEQESVPERALLAIGYGIATPIAWITSTRSRLGWAACAAAAGVTVLLFAFGGVHLTAFMAWFLAIGFTSTGTARFYVWLKNRGQKAVKGEVDSDIPQAAPTSWGADSQLPADGIRI